MSVAQYTEAQRLSAESAFIELFELDTSSLTAINGIVGSGTVYHWISGTIGEAAVSFGGVEYVPLPIDATGFEWNGQGKLPQPKLRVSNIGGFAAALAIEYNDLAGATVTRTRTYAQFLDGQPNADSSAVFELDIFTVNRKSAHNKEFLEFELLAAFDAQGLKLPRRQVIRNTCGQTYRYWTGTGFYSGTCPYVGTLYFKQDGTSTANPAEDVCGKQLADCYKRFSGGAGGNPALPTRAFPGVASVTA